MTAGILDMLMTAMVGTINTSDDYQWSNNEPDQRG